jgi:uncharacterized membrane protein
MKLKFKIYFLVAILLTASSWLISLLFWDKLPAVMPVHFGISGAADGWADKSFLYAFLLPILQTFMTGLFIFLYYKPQYTNMPSTMWLTILDKEHRDRAFDLIRNMMAGTIIIVGILLTYMTYGMNSAALNSSVGLYPGIMIAFLVVLFAWIAYWYFKIYKETGLLIRKINKKEKK